MPDQMAPNRRLRSMLERARQILSPSARSDVPPFMVMDVIAAATRVEAAGPSCDPHGGRPAGGAGAAHRDSMPRGARSTGRLRYTEALGIGSLRATGSRAIMARPIMSISTRHG